jgi:peroxiredoxin Q/BCP
MYLARSSLQQAFRIYLDRITSLQSGPFLREIQNWVGRSDTVGVFGIVLFLASMDSGAQEVKPHSMKIGQIAPDFTLPDQDRNRFNLGQHLGKGPIVVFFYPKDDSPVCTAEACAFRDKYEVFKTMGALVVGISGDQEDSHQKFAAKNRLPFILLSDEKGEVRDAFEVPKKLGLLPGRVTYILDKQGICRGISNSLTNAKSHVEDALAVIRTLK